MSRQQKRVAYEEDNTLQPGDGASADQLFPALTSIVNGERKSFPSKPNTRISPKKKKKFGSTKIGKNKNFPVAQVNTINVSNATQLIPQRQMIDEDDPAAGVANQELTATQLISKARYLHQTK